MDKKGYVMGGLAFLLLIPSVIMLIMLIDVINMDKSYNMILESDTAFQISADIERNVPIIASQTLRESTKEVMNTGKPLSDSRKHIKNIIQSKINCFIRNYHHETGVNMMCVVKSVDSDLDPFVIQINSSIQVSKDNISYNRNISQKIAITCIDVQNTIENGNVYKLEDPLPFIKCKKYGGIETKDGRIYYRSSITKYLNSRHIPNSTAYENSSSPLYIKKCPYEPYTTHGNSKRLFNLKNCIDNGYYHESNDGACFLCRLEGKSTCNHIGLETFIVPNQTIANTLLSAPSSPDHVIFDDRGEIYLGTAVEYYSIGHRSFKIFLDHGHCLKYGLSCA